MIVRGTLCLLARVCAYLPMCLMCLHLCGCVNSCGGEHTGEDCLCACVSVAAAVGVCATLSVSTVEWARVHLSLCVLVCVCVFECVSCLNMGVCECVHLYL